MEQIKKEKQENVLKEILRKEGMLTPEIEEKFDIEDRIHVSGRLLWCSYADTNMIYDRWTKELFDNHHPNAISEVKEEDLGEALFYVNTLVREYGSIHATFASIKNMWENNYDFQYTPLHKECMNFNPIEYLWW